MEIGTNSFEKGMNQDLHEQFMQQGMYRDAQNVVLGSIEGDTVSISNEDGTVNKFNLPSGFIVIGHVSLRKEVILFMVNDSETDSLVGVYNYEADTYITVFQNADLNFKKTCQIDATARVDFRGSRVVYFTDDCNPPRTLDLDILPNSSLDLEPQISLFGSYSPPRVDPIQVLDSGDLTTGVYQFLARYQTRDGDKTLFGDVCNPIPIIDESSTAPRADQDGALPNSFAGKSIGVELSGLSGEYDFVELVVIVYEGLSSTPLAFSLVVLPNDGSNRRYTYVSSSQHLQPVSISEVVQLLPVYNKAKCIEQKDNILFLSNLESDEEIFDWQSFANEIRVDYEIEEVDYFEEIVADHETQNLPGFFAGVTNAFLGTVSVESESEDYKDPIVCYAEKTWRRDEVYALAFEPIFKNGAVGFSYHIPYVDSGGTNKPSNLNKYQSNEDYPVGVGYPTGFGKVTHFQTPSESQEPLFSSSPSTLNNSSNQPLSDSPLTGDNFYNRFETKIRLIKLKITLPALTDTQKSALSGFKIKRAKKRNIDKRVVAAGFANNMIKWFDNDTLLPMGMNGKVAYGSLFNEFSRTSGILFPNGKRSSPPILKDSMASVGSQDDMDGDLIMQDLYAFWSPEILHGHTREIGLANRISHVRTYLAYPNYIYGPFTSNPTEDVFPNNEYPTINLFQILGDFVYATGQAIPFLLPYSDINGAFGTDKNPALALLSVYGNFGADEQVYVNSDSHIGANDAGLDGVALLGQKEITPFFADVPLTTPFEGKSILRWKTTPYFILRVAPEGLLKDTVSQWGLSVDTGNRVVHKDDDVDDPASYVRTAQVDPKDPLGPDLPRRNDDNGNTDSWRRFGDLTWEKYVLLNTQLDLHSPLSGVEYEDAFVHYFDGDFNQTVFRFFGGDTFIFRYALETDVYIPETTDGNGVGGQGFLKQYQLFYTFHEGPHNYNFRHYIEPEGDSFESADFTPGTKPYFPKYTRIYDSNGPIGLYQFLPELGYSTGYNLQYSKTNDVKTSFERPLQLAEVNDFPNLTIYSKKAIESEQEDSMRIFLVNNAYDLPKDKGEIVDTFVMGNTLYLHTEMSLWRTFVNELSMQVSSEGEVFLGAGRLFDKPSTEIISVDDGYGGTISQWGGVNTHFGRIFADLLQKKVFLFNGQQLKDISDSGMSSFFRKAFDSSLTLEDDNPANPDGQGLVAGYDFDLNRFFITQHSKSQNVDDFTLSFNPKLGVWVSRHSYQPHTYTNYGERSFLVRNLDSGGGNFEELNVGPIGNYFGSREVSRIRFIVNKDPARQKVFDNLFLDTSFQNPDSGQRVIDEFFDRIQFKNDYQNSGSKLILFSNDYNPISLDTTVRPHLVRYKKGQFQTAVARDDSGLYGGDTRRLKSKWLDVELSYNNSYNGEDGVVRFVMNMVHTKFRFISR